MKMKKMKNNIIWLCTLIIIVSCETTELNLLENPNNSSPKNLDVDLTLNSIQFNLSEFFEKATSSGSEAVRLGYMFDTYANRYNNTNSDNVNTWRTAYSSILLDIQTLIPIANKNKLFVHSGIAKTIRAYVLMTLVDYFGDVPYSEALKGAEGNIFPKVDAAIDVYSNALEDLNLAISDFGKTSSATPKSDLYYGGSTSQWIKFANTLKLKYYLNTRLINQSESAIEIQKLIDSGNLITSYKDSFLWKAGIADLPQSRHQYYVNEYLSANTTDYISNYLAWSLTTEKSIDDPRLRYYIYRQTNAFPTDPATLNTEIECWNDPRPSTYGPIDLISAVPLPFCSLIAKGDGYWGRDHSDSDGIPPDNTKRSTYGVYPVGGKFDDNDAKSISEGDGLDGAGIWPIMTDSFVYFMRSEAALFLNTSDDPKLMFEKGVKTSIANVMGFLPNPSNFTNIPTQTNVDNYVSTVNAMYDAATSITDKMNVIGKEYWISLFGNGIEAYNLYRRTGAPNNLQPTLLGTGDFPRSFLYPNIVVDRNKNIKQKPNLKTQVFWDNNPEGFIQ